MHFSFFPSTIKYTSKHIDTRHKSPKYAKKDTQKLKFVSNMPIYTSSNECTIRVLWHLVNWSINICSQCELIWITACSWWSGARCNNYYSRKGTNSLLQHRAHFISSAIKKSSWKQNFPFGTCGKRKWTRNYISLLLEFIVSNGVSRWLNIPDLHNCKWTQKM